MKLSKIVSIILALAMMLSISIVAYAADPVWELTEAEIKELIASGDGTDFLQNSGDGSKFISADGNSMVFSGGRPNDYSVVDLKVQDICKPGVEYTLVVQMTAPSSTTLKLVETSGYSSLAEKENATEATLSYKFSDPSTRIRFQTNDTNAFTIVSAQLWEGDPPASAPASGGETAAANPQTGENSIIYFAGIALALAACGAFVFYRKAKAE